MKFLIIRLSSIGDIVLTTPVIRCLQQQVQGAEIHFLVKPQFQEVVKYNPYISKLHFYSADKELMIAELKAEKFDAIIDLHHNTKTLRIKKALGVKAHSFYKLNIQKYLLTAFKINMLPNEHIVDRYLKTVAPFGVRNDGKGLDYFIAPSDETTLKDIPASHHAGYIACVIGAAHGTKKWPIQKWSAFCAAMPHPIILLGGPEDAAAGHAIAGVDDIKVYNACGKFKLNESADLIRKAKLVITHDTGLMHIAAAFNKPIISIWGNTIPAFGMTPYYGAKMVVNVILQAKKMWCRPCSKIGYNKCPLGHFKCMEKINVEDLLQRAKQNI
jgi:heptosyltransferase-2